MKIKEMFKDDIDRKINGVVQVEQDKEDVVKQEVKEYVVTSELKKHFTKFFNEYSESFDEPTDNVGVWITGFFGSGKSHFLKMLSYLLENKEIDGKKTVDYFEEKFDDQLSFMNIQKSVQVPTETILFNIDAESTGTKDDSSVIRAFARVFYDHLGFYAKDLNLARFEQYVTSIGKMDAFKQAFEKNVGKSYLEARGSYRFRKKNFIDSAVESGAMDKENAELWFADKGNLELTPSDLVDEIKAYVDSKPKGFRLVFMADEVGQYVGTDRNMILKLQSFVELCGSKCRGQVWVIATGQEALDEMIKVRTDEFSRVMARFPIRLSLTSSSVGEVIEKRLLTKTDEATNVLGTMYDNNNNALANLYAFDTALKDLKGYASKDEYIRIYPFVPYQFIIMQKVFNEIRKHGHAGKHQSSGERSMLNGFQESAQHIEDKNELTLVPMYGFYDTLHSFLDTSVRSVIERAEKAAENGNGLEIIDVNLLKLLFLFKYVDDIKTSIDNLVILMADSISVDKIELRKQVGESLNRLENQNYISRVAGDAYVFLTDEEQEIAREINNYPVDTAKVIGEITTIIFDDLYTTKKFKYTKDGYNLDFDFDKAVDNVNHGFTTGGMKLRFITEVEYVDDLKLVAESKGDEAICRLNTEYSVFERIEKAKKIEGYIIKKGTQHSSESIEKIIMGRQQEKARLIKEATEALAEAIIHGKFFINGTVCNIAGTSVKAVLDNAMTKLVEETYDCLRLVDTFAKDESDIRNILKGNDTPVYSLQGNIGAIEAVYEYLRNQKAMKMATSMSDVQTKFQGKPYGWREIDIAAVMARLIVDQKVTIKHNGQTIQRDDYHLIDYLRKKTEIGVTMVSIRESIPAQKIRQVKDILHEYFNIQDIPKDEDGLIAFITKQFEEQKYKLEQIRKNYETKKYPGLDEVDHALGLVKKVLNAKDDNLILINTICDLEDDLLDSSDEISDVINFFSTQKNLYDHAVTLKKDINDAIDCFEDNQIISEQVNKIKEITKVTSHYQYNRIKDLNECISIINEENKKVVDAKKKEIIDCIDLYISDLEERTEHKDKLQDTLNVSIEQLNNRKQEVLQATNILALVAKKVTIDELYNRSVEKMNAVLNEPVKPVLTPPTPVQKKKVRPVQRNILFNQASLSSEEDVDKYLAQIKNKLLKYIRDDEEVEIK